MGIIMRPDEFPEHRRQDPKRAAEAKVFDALRNMVLNGYGLYECRYRRGGKQVDFTLWVDDVARFAVQVKGGKYDLDDYGNWSLRTPDGGPKGGPSPLEETEDGCMEMRDGIREATSYTNFVVGVLMFPDMEPDRRMEEAALKRSHVYIIWGLDHLSEDLERIAKRAPYKRPPRSRISENEWSSLHRLQYGSAEGQRDLGEEHQECPQERAGTWDSEGHLNKGSVTIHIQHLERLVVQHIRVAPDADGEFRLPEA